MLSGAGNSIWVGSSSRPPFIPALSLQVGWLTPGKFLSSLETSSVNWCNNISFVELSWYQWLSPQGKCLDNDFTESSDYHTWWESQQDGECHPSRPVCSNFVLESKGPDNTQNCFLYLPSAQSAESVRQAWDLAFLSHSGVRNLKKPLTQGFTACHCQGPDNSAHSPSTEHFFPRLHRFQF